MLNRVAESMFWVGRYAERAENHARFVDVHFHIRDDLETADSSRVWMKIVDALGDPQWYQQQYGALQEPEVLYYLTLDRQFSNSLVSCVAAARNNLRVVREKVPGDLWDSMNSTFLWLSERRREDIAEMSPFLFYREVKAKLASFQGSVHSLMPRDELWSMLESGRCLERAENTVRILQSVCSLVAEDRGATYTYLLAVLKSVSGYEAFRRLQQEELGLAPILHFLVLNEVFPRSIQYAFSMLESHLKSVRQREGRTNAHRDRTIRLASKIRSDLAWLDKGDIRTDAIEELLTGLLKSSDKLGESMAMSFFQDGGGIGA